MSCPLGFGKEHVPIEAPGPSLSTQRTPSKIPTVSGELWEYPSPHQFHAATLQKGHSIDGSDIPMIVDIHNAVNDEAWRRIQRFEERVRPECDLNSLKLIRFVGRPGSRSPKSLVMESLFGWTAPFDRHDWLVQRSERCSSTSTRYIVDFYDGKPDPNRPGVAVFIDARPALDSWEGWVDRFKGWWVGG